MSEVKKTIEFPIESEYKHFSTDKLLTYKQQLESLLEFIKKLIRQRIQQ